MFHHFGRALEGADFTHTGDVTAVPFHPELEVLVGIEPRWINAELGHGWFLRLFVRLSLGFDLSGHLLDLDDDKFGRLKRSETDQDVDHSAIDVVLGGSLAVALHEV